MDNKFTALACNDDDVILFEKDTFKVSRLKELFSREIATKLSLPIYNTQTKTQEGIIISTLSRVSFGLERIDVAEIQFNSIKTCEILHVGGKGWQKGNLKIHASKTIVKNQLTVCLEFCPDKPNESESPLDEIRQRMNS